MDNEKSEEKSDERRAEKRKSIRINKPLAVQFGFKTDGTITWDISLIKDISESGICIHTSMMLQKNDTCYLRFKMPTHPWDTLEIQAHVIDSVQTGKPICNTRLEFVSLNDEQLELLREYVAWALIKERSGK
jgi:hypothetical protein